MFYWSYPIDQHSSRWVEMWPCPPFSEKCSRADLLLHLPPLGLFQESRHWWGKKLTGSAASTRSTCKNRHTNAEQKVTIVWVQYRYDGPLCVECVLGHSLSLSGPGSVSNLDWPFIYLHVPLCNWLTMTVKKYSFKFCNAQNINSWKGTHKQYT